ncbi:long-chain fatty acid--CoA ligase [Brevibacillus laterosporus]|uniref:long-chain fatty acid--CoA ligase n=1 Tax=Brevibacillus laterosporus TaxID=1465 RepID=UPI00036C896F|nr:long-chain fatty acid--CoA ligase [Brevibacillus laterosporus]ATO48777.1 fatty-acid--CoA ligase [Brevibacillus laterosporus DSM 25]MBG9800639.1 fatty-acid--CoA ligase [Brevibacillus laterosporus]MED2002251.1 long-chain fatty acid--CoA ligase [Brevibacillus laterosporus]MED4764839.1 long-chain fatty acid--CoA ligase [Brevibacillus laterosporus]TPH17280.1 fatty-acid--CoA ligase [Brevibacillus laterosporus]
MMNAQLTLAPMMERAEKMFGKKQVISRTSTGIYRFTYTEIAERTRRLASVLESLGIKRGERVGTLAWNHHRHLEAYFAIPSMGAVLHTINIRLSPEHIVYIINHAEDQVLLIDDDILPLIEQLKDHLHTVKAYVLMTDHDQLPASSLEPLYSYEQLLNEADPSYQYPTDIQENDPAGMCYTSATTGNPKGVIYSHRGIVLHSMSLGLADTLALAEQDIAMPVVPMFHVNAWGFPFAATWFGCTQVMPGPRFTPQILAHLIETEKISITAGVPTIWLGLLQELENGRYETSSLRAVVCGGSASPRSLVETYRKKFNIPFYVAYGMTETSPLVTCSKLKSYQEAELSEEEKLDILCKQGTLVPGLQMKIVGPHGEVKADGEEMGELLIRGPWIADSYYKDERSEETFQDGWLHTGDVATVDAEGFVKLVDRTKDLIKSGGEWISSVDVENALMGHESILEASCVGVPHPQWGERPIACVVIKEGQSVSKDEILAFLEPKFAKWWLPDDVLFVKEIPKTSVGKFLKRALREQIVEHYSKEPQA